MKVEFSVFQKLNNTSPALQIRKHQVRKVILNVFHIFFQDFTDKNVHVEIEGNNSSLNFDYESIFVALYHVIENTTKYIAPNSRLKVNFVETTNGITVKLDMLSIQIKKRKWTVVFVEGYSGVIAKELEQSW